MTFSTSMSIPARREDSGWLRPALLLSVIALGVWGGEVRAGMIIPRDSETRFGGWDAEREDHDLVGGRMSSLPATCPLEGSIPPNDDSQNPLKNLSPPSGSSSAPNSNNSGSSSHAEPWLHSSDVDAYVPSRFRVVAERALQWPSLILDDLLRPPKASS